MYREIKLFFVLPLPLEKTGSSTIIFFFANTAFLLSVDLKLLSYYILILTVLIAIGIYGKKKLWFTISPPTLPEPMKTSSSKPSYFFLGKTSTEIHMQKIWAVVHTNSRDAKFNLHNHKNCNNLRSWNLYHHIYYPDSSKLTYQNTQVIMQTKRRKKDEEWSCELNKK